MAITANVTNGKLDKTNTTPTQTEKQAVQKQVAQILAMMIS